MSETKRKFDPDKPHDEIHGSKSGMKYEQDGYYFNAQGQEVGRIPKMKGRPSDIVPKDKNPVGRPPKTITVPGPKGLDLPDIQAQVQKENIQAKQAENHAE